MGKAPNPVSLFRHQLESQADDVRFLTQNRRTLTNLPGKRSCSSTKITNKDQSHCFEAKAEQQVALAVRESLVLFSDIKTIHALSLF